MAEPTHMPKDDQGDSGPDRDHPVPQPRTRPSPRVDPEDAHIGATEEEVSDTPPPAGEEFEDEPRQG